MLAAGAWSLADAWDHAGQAAASTSWHRSGAGSQPLPAAGTLVQGTRGVPVIPGGMRQGQQGGLRAPAAGLRGLLPQEEVLCELAQHLCEGQTPASVGIWERGGPQGAATLQCQHVACRQPGSAGSSLRGRCPVCACAGEGLRLTWWCLSRPSEGAGTAWYCSCNRRTCWVR